MPNNGAYLTELNDTNPSSEDETINEGNTLLASGSKKTRFRESSFNGSSRFPFYNTQNSWSSTQTQNNTFTKKSSFLRSNNDSILSMDYEIIGNLNGIREHQLKVDPTSSRRLDEGNDGPSKSNSKILHYYNKLNSSQKSFLYIFLIVIPAWFLLKDFTIEVPYNEKSVKHPNPLTNNPLSNTILLLNSLPSAILMVNPINEIFKRYAKMRNLNFYSLEEENLDFIRESSKQSFSLEKYEIISSRSRYYLDDFENDSNENHFQNFKFITIFTTPENYLLHQTSTPKNITDRRYQNQFYYSFIKNPELKGKSVSDQKIEKFIKTLEKKLDFYFVYEYFDLSLILMKVKYNLEWEDVVYLRDDQHFRKFNGGIEGDHYYDVEKVRRLNGADLRVYQHFKGVFGVFVHAVMFLA